LMRLCTVPVHPLLAPPDIEDREDDESAREMGRRG
jgi:hypothetical protein